MNSDVTTNLQMLNEVKSNEGQLNKIWQCKPCEFKKTSINENSMAK